MWLNADEVGYDWTNVYVKKTLHCLVFSCVYSEILCDKPAILPNGKFYMDKSQYKIKETIKYSCAKGYLLIGKEISKCVLNSDKISASFDSRPSCKGNIYCSLYKLNLIILSYLLVVPCSRRKGDTDSGWIYSFEYEQYNNSTDLERYINFKFLLLKLTHIEHRTKTIFSANIFMLRSLLLLYDS